MHAPKLLSVQATLNDQVRSGIEFNVAYGPITIRVRFERDTTSFEELCAFEQ